MQFSSAGTGSWTVPEAPLIRVPVVSTPFESTRCQKLPFQPSPHESSMFNV
jgi:hypothetical protein